MPKQFLATIRGRISCPLQYYQDICVRCDACIDACHFYATSRDAAHTPAYRVLMVKKVLQAGGEWQRRPGVVVHRIGC